MVSLYSSFRVKPATTAPIESEMLLLSSWL